MFKTVKRIIRWCGEFRGKLYLGFVFSFFSTWFAAMPIMAAAYTVGLLIQGRLERKWIGLSLLVIGALVLLRFLFSYLQARFQEAISYELVARDRLAIGEALKRVSLGYFQQVDTGNILNSITTGLHTLENMGIRMVDSFIGGYLNFLCILLCLLAVSPLAALISLAGTALSFLFLLLVSRHSAANAPVSAQAGRDLTAATLEYARGLPVVKSFGQGGASMAAMRKAIRGSRDICLKIEWGFIPSNCLHLLALKIASVALAGTACWLALTGVLELPMMLMICFFSFGIFAGLEPISDSAHVLSVINNAMDQLDALRENHFIDQDGREFTCDSLLKHISMVFQNVYLFHDTIRANICFGRPDATEEEMIAAAKKARCHDFIMALPDGYDTVVGEGGGSLSGGEKQRISIARAILKDAPIIILDEATASIDPENEHLIQAALSELTRGKTIITIAHRLATIQNTAQILVVDDGRIVQRGTHWELAAQPGRYRSFVETRRRAEGWNIA